MKLLIQPGAGVLPLQRAIAAAKHNVDIVIFRFDRTEIERALGDAVARGVAVKALIAYTNRAGEASLRALETRLLGMGVTVSRTASDLARYHDKLMIIDRRELFLLAFNLTYQDMERSRSFGLVTRSREAVHEAVRLFEADTERQPFESKYDRFVVSPINARKQLSAFIAGAKKELLIYDPKVSDPAIIKLMAERARAGVRIRVIGELLAGKVPNATARKLSDIRLHTRTMIRDGALAFVGSQSLRKAELDTRREVGLIFREAAVVRKLAATFESDWAEAERADQEEEARDENTASAKVAKKIAKAVTKEMPPMASLLNGAVERLTGELGDNGFNSSELEQMVKGAVKDAVREAVKGVVEEMAEKIGGGDD